MAFQIVVVADVKYEMGNETFGIPRAAVQEGETALVSKPAFKEDVTTYSVRFKAPTIHGPFEWEVQYFIGVQGYGIKKVCLVTFPADVREVEDLEVETVESGDDDVFDELDDSKDDLCMLCTGKIW